MFFVSLTACISLLERRHLYLSKWPSLSQSLLVLTCSCISNLVPWQPHFLLRGSNMHFLSRHSTVSFCSHIWRIIGQRTRRSSVPFLLHFYFIRDFTNLFSNIFFPTVKSAYSNTFDLFFGKQSKSGKKKAS